MPLTSSISQVTPVSFFKTLPQAPASSSLAPPQTAPEQNEGTVPSSFVRPVSQNLDGNIALGVVGFHWLSQRATAFSSAVRFWFGGDSPANQQALAQDESNMEEPEALQSSHLELK